MTYHLHPDDPTILVATIEGDGITWEAYRHLIVQMVAQAQSKDGRVDAIFDGRADMPRGNPFAHLRWAAERFEHAGNIHVIANILPVTIPLARTFVQMADRMYYRRLGLHVVLVSSMGEALTVIARDRSRV